MLDNAALVRVMLLVVMHVMNTSAADIEVKELSEMFGYIVSGSDIETIQWHEAKSLTSCATRCAEHPSLQIIHFTSSAGCTCYTSCVTFDDYVLTSDMQDFYSFSDTQYYDHRHSNKCYMLFEEQNWSTAKQTCIDHNMLLMSAETERESNFVHGVISEYHWSTTFWSSGRVSGFNLYWDSTGQSIHNEEIYEDIFMSCIGNCLSVGTLAWHCEGCNDRRKFMCESS